MPSLVYTPLPSPWGLLDGFIDPLFRDAVISLMESHLCSFLATVEVPYPMNAVSHAGAFSPQGPHRPSLPVTITSHFVTLVRVLRRLDLVIQQFFTGYMITAICWRNGLLRLHYLIIFHTIFYLPRWQPLSKSHLLYLALYYTGFTAGKIISLQLLT